MNKIQNWAYLDLLLFSGFMQHRLDYRTAAPGVIQVMLGFPKYLEASDLEGSLLELVRIRASQMNGCTHCLEIHIKDAKANGEDDQRLHLVAAWREAPFYTDR